MWAALRPSPTCVGETLCLRR